MYRKLPLFIVLIFMNASMGIASDVSHPPTYDQIKKSYTDDDSFNTDLYEAFQYTEEAVRASEFNNYWAEFSENSIKTSVFLGYSKLAAQLHALGLQHDMFIYFKLANYILKHSPSKNDILLCREMGTILKKNSTTVLGDYVSIAIQKKSIEMLKKYNNTEKDLSAIEDLKAEIKILTDALSKIGHTYDISEKRWEQYYTDLYGKSEQYAIKKLMNEHPVHLK